MGAGASTAGEEKGDDVVMIGHPAGLVLDPGKLVKVLGVEALGWDLEDVKHVNIPLAKMSLKAQRRLAPAAMTKAEMAAAFKPATSVTDAVAWVGTLIDVFSPDYTTPERLPCDMNPGSTRFIEPIEGALVISGDHGDTSKADSNRWGRRFYPVTTPQSVFVSLESTGEAHVKTANFASTVKRGTPAHADARNGALDFRATLGTVNDHRCIKWSSIYLGHGGDYAGNDVPSGEAENFWIYEDIHLPARYADNYISPQLEKKSDSAHALLRGLDRS